MLLDIVAFLKRPSNRWITDDSVGTGISPLPKTAALLYFDVSFAGWQKNVANYGSHPAQSTCTVVQIFWHACRSISLHSSEAKPQRALSPDNTGRSNANPCYYTQRDRH